MGVKVTAFSSVTLDPSFSHKRLISYEIYCRETRREARTICIILLGASTVSETSLNAEMITHTWTQASSLLSSGKKWSHVSWGRALCRDVDVNDDDIIVVVVVIISRDDSKVWRLCNRNTAHVKCKKTKVIPVIMRRLEPSQNHSENTWAIYRKGTKSRKYRKQPYWSLHTYFEKYYCKSTKHWTGEIILRVPWIVAVEYLQYYVPHKCFRYVTVSILHTADS